MALLTRQEKEDEFINLLELCGKDQAYRDQAAITIQSWNEDKLNRILIRQRCIVWGYSIFDNHIDIPGACDGITVDHDTTG